MNTVRMQYLADELRVKDPLLLLDQWAECASGFATRLPEFNAQGFHHGPAGFAPRFGNKVGRPALMAFFDLDRHQADLVFALIEMRNPFRWGREWARVIEREILRHRVKTLPHRVKSAVVGWLRSFTLTPQGGRNAHFAH